MCLNQKGAAAQKTPVMSSSGRFAFHGMEACSVSLKHKEIARRTLHLDDQDVYGSRIN